ncbi:MAG TPA: TetR/AcrR family transcriptional regulator [Lentimicrobium sp.]|nr:TetR/AcrR family transcriptional regulator [Lentimicrobium sp.]
MIVQKSSTKMGALLESGKELFWKYGVRKVSVEEICRHAGVSKMTFYRYFTDKTALAKSVFDAEVEKSMVRFTQIMESDIPSDEKLKHIFLMKSESVENISQEFIRDFYSGSEPELQQHIREKTQQIWQGILEDFRKAQQKGDFRKDFKPELMFYISTKISEFLNDPYLISLCGTQAEVIREITRLFTYGIGSNPCNQ